MGVRRSLLAAATAVAVVGCTAQPAAETSRPPPSAQAGPTRVARQVPARETEPVVLVTHATAPRATLTWRQAKRLLAGRPSRWSVLAAPGMPVGPDVATAASPESVLRAVEHRPGLLGVVPASAVTPTVSRVVVDGVDPLRRPDRYRPRTEGPPAPRPTTLTLTGDLMLTRGVRDPAAALRPLAERLRAADLTVGNLESTLSRQGAPRQGGDSFGADPRVLGPLRRAGFDALSLANNHTGDYGPRALVETVRAMVRSPIVPFGAGADRAQAGRPAILRRNGVKFGFLGFNAIGETPRATSRAPGALSVRMPPRTGPLNAADLLEVADRVRRLAHRVDVVVVLPHWGTQYTHDAGPAQRHVARELVRAGADLVVGGHPHWVQGLEAVQGTVVAHSLGNFVFDMDFMTQTQQGVLLEATYWGRELKAVDLVPYRMDGAFAPRPATPTGSADILGDVWSASFGPFSHRP